MELFQLKYFSAVAEAGSFAKAARLVHVSQPSLSVQIGRLEDTLGSKLFYRSVKGVRLTPAGARVLASVDRIFAEVREMREDIVKKNLFPFEVLRIGVQPLLASVYLPTRLQRYLAHNADVRIQIMERPNALLSELVLRGEVNVSLVAQSDVAFKSMKSRKLFSCGYCVFAHSKSVLDKHRQWTLQKLLDEPLLLYRDPMGIEDRLRNISKRSNKPINIRFLSDQAITMLDFCMQKLGVAVLPEIAEEKAKAMGLYCRPIRENNLSYRVDAFFKDAKMQDDSVRALFPYLIR